MENVSLSFAVVGVIELVKRLFDKDFKSAAIIAAAALAGALLATQVEATWFQGVLVGLTASGFVTTASYFSSK